MTRFERRLREHIDSKYLREPTADNPLWRLVNGRLPLEECRAFYLGLRDSLAVFNRVLLGRLLEESPSEKARSELLPVIAVEFGPPASAAHPAVFQKFLRSLGVSEAETNERADLLAEASPCASEVEALRRMSWCELLARLLVGETQGPVVFPAILDALRRNYGLTSFDVQYFSIHATHDKKDTEILFDLLARSAESQADQDAVLRVVDETFDSGRYAVTGCRLEAKPRYRFADYSSDTLRRKAGDPSAAGASDLPEPSPNGPSPGRDVVVSLEKSMNESRTAPVRQSVHRARAALRARLSDESHAARDARASEAVGPRHLLERTRRVAHEWEFVVAPYLLQMCPDFDARVLLWQVAYASYGARRGEVPAMKLLSNLQSTLGAAVASGAEALCDGARERAGGPETARGHGDTGRAGEYPSRRAAIHRLTFLELLARGLVADNLITLEYLPVVREMLLAAPSRLRESDLVYFDRALLDAELGLEAGVDLLARYAPADAIDALIDRGVEQALDASLHAPLAERARPSHPRSHPDVTAIIA